MYRCVLVLLSLCLTFPLAQAQLLKPGDKLAVVGGGFADRMQHSGWFEAKLHALHPQHHFSLRHLACAGDEVTTWHRSQDFGSQDEWLKRVEADVILAFWGFNESFQGPDGLAKFKEDLGEWVDAKRGQVYSKDTPRIVLFSPAATEDTGNPNLPEVVPLNQNLALYAKATAEVAGAKEVPFVDLFQLSLEMFKEHDEQLTVNGLHLKTAAYEHLAGPLLEGLLGEREFPQVADSFLALVRDKNAKWFSRYRTVDGYNVYGGRSKRVYSGVSNFEVMQQEMKQRDALTKTRDVAIWAAMKGQKFTIHDKDLIPVKVPPTNLPEHRIAPYPDPKEAIAKMKVHSGMQVNLFASEKEFPELANPVQMAWDMQNRLWVAAWPTYPGATPTDKVLDKLLVFEDTDWDGKADKMTTFADGLNSPTGFQLYKDGVLVMQAPDLLWLRDTDGDGKADWSQRMLNGIDSADSHHTTNAMAYDPGGGIYLSDGVFHRTQVETAEGPKRNVDGSIYRYDPRSGEFDWYMAHGFANPHGKAFDRWGNSFITDATGNVNYFGCAASGYTSNGRKHARLKEFWKRPSRPCPATEILSSAHFPEEFQGNFLNANVISFQGIFRVGVTYEGSGPEGETLEHLVYSEPKENQHFRPICMANGPDGALYFCDWSQTIIGHLQHHIRDPQRDHQHGRIYRITYEGRPLATPPKIHGESIETLLDHLKSPVNGTRLLAKIELDTHPSEAVTAAVASRVAEAETEHEKMELLWVHQWHHTVNQDLLEMMLASPQGEARAAAGRVLCYWRDRVSDPLGKLQALCTDPHPRVRLEGLRMASFYQGEDAVVAANAALASLTLPTDDYLEYILKETMQQLEPWWRPALVEGKMAPGSPAGAAYLLSTVNNEELLAMPRIPVVLTAWLVRPGIPEQKRLEALADLTLASGQTGAEIILTHLESKRDDMARDDLGRLLTRQPASDLQALGARLEKLGNSPAILAARILAEGTIDPLWKASLTDEQALAQVLQAIPWVADASVRATSHDRVQQILTQLPEPLASKLTDASPMQGRYVRVSLPKQGILTLSEVQVMSGNQNVALQGTATQSSVASGGVPERAIDGNTDGRYGASSSTHTKEPDKDPWWEVDLGRSHPIEAITIWNRTEGRLGRRLRNFNLTILDDARRPVFEALKNKAPETSVSFEVGPGDPKGVIQRAAIAALVSTQQKPGESFVQLCGLIEKHESLTAAARALRKIRRESWEAEAAGRAAKAIHAWAKEIPNEGRTSQDFVENVQAAMELATYLPSEEAAGLQKGLRDLGVNVIVLRTVHEQLRYDTSTITVEANKPFEIVFENDDLMPHNLIICQKGGMQILGTAALTMTPDQVDKQGRTYVPKSDQVIAATKMLEAGEKARLPVKGLPAGDYEYVCTFPGHWSVMNGTLTVK